MVSATLEVTTFAWSDRGQERLVRPSFH